MQLLTNELRAHLPALYTTEHQSDPVVQCKFFTPDSNWTWFVLEFDGDDTFLVWLMGLKSSSGILA